MEKKVVVIDEDKDFCLLMQLHLSKRNCDVSICHNLHDGLKLIKKERPDIILCSLDFANTEDTLQSTLSSMKDYTPRVYLLKSQPVSTESYAEQLLNLPEEKFSPLENHPEQSSGLPEAPLMNPFFTWLDRNKDLGVLFLRLFIGIRLIYGVADNVLSHEHMLKFSDFLQQFNFPVPLVSANVSVYAQLLAGLSFILGWKIRWAAMLMIVNFLVAVIMVHRGQTFEEMTPALAMIFSSLLFLFQGAGKYSLDHRHQRPGTTEKESDKM